MLSLNDRHYKYGVFRDVLYTLLGHLQAERSYNLLMDSAGLLSDRIYQGSDVETQPCPPGTTQSPRCK